jgi:hypothetical protein
VLTSTSWRQKLRTKIQSQGNENPHCRGVNPCGWHSFLSAICLGYIDFFTMSELSEKLGRAMISLATDFVGMEEIKSNAVWDDKATARWDKEKSEWLTAWMLKVKGWTFGAPYCVAFDGAIAAASLERLGISSKLFLSKWTAHVMTNVNMLRGLKLHSLNPTVGAIWLAQFNSTPSGHAGLVITAGSHTMTTVEANTIKQSSTNGSANAQRNGDGIWIRNFAIKGRGKLATRAFCSTEALLKLSRIDE